MLTSIECLDVAYCHRSYSAFRHGHDKLVLEVACVVGVGESCGDPSHLMIATCLPKHALVLLDTLLDDCVHDEAYHEAEGPVALDASEGAFHSHRHGPYLDDHGDTYHSDEGKVSFEDMSGVAEDDIVFYDVPGGRSHHPLLVCCWALRYTIVS